MTSRTLVDNVEGKKIPARGTMCHTATFWRLHKKVYLLSILDIDHSYSYTISPFAAVGTFLLNGTSPPVMSSTKLFGGS
jgi:hypothetical protein